MPKRSTWLVKQWLDEWQLLTTSSRWQRAKGIVQRNQLIDVSIKERQISGVVKGSEVYHQQITCEELEFSVIEEIKEAFLSDASLVLLVYLKTSDHVKQKVPPLRTVFSIPRLRFHCSCLDAVSPCKHIAAVAMAAAVEIEKDYAQFLQFRGIPWDDILQSIEPKEAAYDEENHRVNYSMVPLPSQGSNTPVFKKTRFSPPFWVSPFPFPLMLEEIYTKVAEDIDEE